MSEINKDKMCDCCDNQPCSSCHFCGGDYYDCDCILDTTNTKTRLIIGLGILLVIGLGIRTMLNNK